MYTRAQHIAIFLLSVFLTFAAFVGPLQANPQGGTVVAGQANIQHPDAKTVQIQQGSDKAIIDWRSFSIAGDERTLIQQPSSSSMLLNRVTGGDPSKIYGQLSANGKIILVNPAGIYFGPSARINVNSLIATTANIRNEDFLNGQLQFIQAPGLATTVVNEGEIKAAGGLVALVAPGVVNSGVIEANLGKVALASGNEFTIDLYGDQLINFAVNNKVKQKPVDTEGKELNDAVKNSGTIIADGGKIIMTASVAQGVVQNVINMEGVAQARTVIQKNGEIILDGGNTGVVKVRGKLDVSGKAIGSKGGTVKVLAQRVELINAQIDASGDAGGGTVLIGGNYQGKGPEANAQTTLVDANTLINASSVANGDGGKVILWSDDYTQFQGKIKATGGIESGNGGFAEVSGKAVLDYQGHVDLTASHGEMGTLLLDPYDIEIRNTANNPASPTFPYTSTQNTSVINTTTLATALSSANITIQTGSGGAQTGNITVVDDVTWTGATTLTLIAHNNIAINNTITNNGGGGIVLRANNGGTYAVGSGNGTVTISGSINFNNGGTAKIYYNPTSYNASMPSDFNNMVGYTTRTVYMNVNNATDLQNMNTNLAGNYALTTNIDASSIANFSPVGNSSTPFTGNFDGLNYTISNLTITNNSATNSIGMFGQTSGSTLANVGFINANVTAVTNNGQIGLLVGKAASSSTISNVYAINSNVTGGSTSFFGSIGGLVGQLVGSMSASYASGGTVTNTQTGYVGGLVGLNNGTITTSYNANTVSNTASGSSVGGIVGFSEAGSTVSDTYNLGKMVNSANSTSMGGILGVSSGATMNRSINIGSINNTGTGTNIGALIGSNSGTVTDSFWDSNTSGISSGAGGGSGGSTNMTAGCFTGSGCAAGTANLSAQATYDPAFNFTTTWGIIAATSYPYLKAIYSSTPQIVSGQVYTDQGTTAANANNTVQVAINGSAINTGTLSTFANGAFYFTLPNSSFTSGDELLVFTKSGSSATGTAVITANSTNMTGLKLYNNTVIARSDSGTPLTNTILGTAKGSLNDAGILYSVTSANLTLNSGVNFLTWLEGASTRTTYNLDGNITASGSGNMTFQGAVNLTTDAALTTGTGSITFNRQINSATSTARSLTITAAGGTTLNENIGNINVLNQLTITGPLTINNSGIVTNGNQTYNGNITLASASPNFTNNGGDTYFNGTIDGAADLVFSAGGTTTFAGNVGSITPLNSIFSLGGTINFGANITTSGYQQYINPMILTGDTVLTSNSSYINFYNTINGAHALTTTAAGGILFSYAVGGVTPLASLTVNNPSSDYVTIYESITTTGNQTYNQTISQIYNGVNFTSSGGNITFAGQLDAISTGADLSFNAANTLTFADVVGVTANAFDVINVGNSGTVNITNVINRNTLTGNAGTVNVNSNSASINDAYQMVATGGTINLAPATYNESVVFNKAVNLATTGAVTLNSLTNNAAMGLKGNYTVGTGNFTFNQAVTLTGDTTLNAGSKDLTIGSAFAGNYALNLISQNNVIINNSLGSSNNRLGAINITGNTTLNGSNYYTVGNQIYNSPVTLGNNVVFDASNGGVTFNSTLNGPYNLTFNTPNGDITFVGAAGSSANRLGAMQITNARNVTEQNVLKVTSFTQANGSGTTAFGTADVDASGDVYVNTNYISGLIVSGGAVTLIGRDGIDAQVIANALTVGGSNGGTLTGTINGLTGYYAMLQTSLMSGSQGLFTMNGYLLNIALSDSIANLLKVYSGNAEDENMFLNELDAEDIENEAANSTVEINDDNSYAKLLAAQGICQ